MRNDTLKLLGRLRAELEEIRWRVNGAEMGTNPYDFISARMAINEAETTLTLLGKEIRNEIEEHQRVSSGTL